MHEAPTTDPPPPPADQDVPILIDGAGGTLPGLWEVREGIARLGKAKDLHEKQRSLNQYSADNNGWPQKERLTALSSA